MKRFHLVAVLVGFMAIVAFAKDAAAMYNPSTGTFLQRDPGAVVLARIGSAEIAARGRFAQRDPYADGMNLYQYVKSRPTVLRDPLGTNVLDDAVAALQDLEQRKNHDYSMNAGPGPDAAYLWQLIQQTKQRISNLQMVSSGFKIGGHSMGAPRSTADRLGVNSPSGGHADLYYNGKNIRTGKGGGTPLGQDLLANNWWPDIIVVTDLPVQRSPMWKLGHGNFAGTACNVATDAQIMSCVQSAPCKPGKYDPFTNNCWQDVIGAACGCCLARGKVVYFAAVGTSEEGIFNAP